MAEKHGRLKEIRKKLLPHRGEEWRNSWVKDFSDKLLIFPIAFIGLVPALCVAHIIKEEDGGSIFYIDKRVGKGGKEINVYKFRSLKPGNESTKDSLRFYQDFTNENDPRATKIGRLLRQVDFDEYPQAIQILLGQLALVEFRAIEPSAIELLHDQLPKNEFENYIEKKFEGKRQGVFDPSVGKVINTRSDLERIPFQLDYAKNAHLDKDLAIYFGISLLILNKIAKKIKKRINRKKVSVEAENS